MQCTFVPEIEAAETVIVCAASSFEWAVFLSPAIIFASACIAIVGIFSSRATARKRATLDMIEKVESNEHYRKIHSRFSTTRRKKRFAALHNPVSDEDAETRQSVYDYLNHYEIVALGIRSKILDAKVYRSWMRGPFVRDWNAASEFVQRERWKWNKEEANWEYYKRLFESYQWLVLKWDPTAIKLTELSDRPPKDPPQGPGDEHLPGGHAG